MLIKARVFISEMLGRIEYAWTFNPNTGILTGTRFTFSRLGEPSGVPIDVDLGVTTEKRFREVCEHFKSRGQLMAFEEVE